jgi:hypothetical protein
MDSCWDHAEPTATHRLLQARVQLVIVCGIDVLQHCRLAHAAVHHQLLYQQLPDAAAP